MPALRPDVGVPAIPALGPPVVLIWSGVEMAMLMLPIGRPMTWPVKVPVVAMPLTLMLMNARPAIPLMRAAAVMLVSAGTLVVLVKCRTAVQLIRAAAFMLVSARTLVVLVKCRTAIPLIRAGAASMLVSAGPLAASPGPRTSRR
jgi:hypothetical protein